MKGIGAAKGYLPPGPNTNYDFNFSCTCDEHGSRNLQIFSLALSQLGYLCTNVKYVICLK